MTFAQEALLRAGLCLTVYASAVIWFVRWMLTKG